MVVKTTEDINFLHILLTILGVLLIILLAGVADILLE